MEIIRSKGSTFRARCSRSSITTMQVAGYRAPMQTRADRVDLLLFVIFLFGVDRPDVLFVYGSAGDVIDSDHRRQH